jgi:hypothetical protein
MSERPYESVDTYIPTPDATGNCEPHIKETNLEDWYWVVCEDCSKDLVEGKANALAALNDCEGESS